MSVKEIKRQYVNPSLTGSFSGLENFSHALNERGLNVEKKKLEQVLKTVDAYTRHRPVTKKFQRHKVVVAGIDDTWQVDLVDMQAFSRYNKGFKYLITCIDVFSKYAWVVPIKTKSGKDTLDGIKKIIADGRKPKHLHADRGKEFYNKTADAYFKKENIHLYSIENEETAACVVERFNRTLKEKMFRYFTATKQFNTHKKSYLNVLPDLVSTYNNSKHRTINMKPIDVNETNKQALWNRMYMKDDEDTIIKFKFEVGDIVRVSFSKEVFEKGYTPNWTHKLYRIYKRIAKIPPAYKLVNFLNNPDDPDNNHEDFVVAQGIYYEPELQFIASSDSQLVEIKHIRAEANNKAEEYLIKWIGQDRIDTWVRETDLEEIETE